ncbi:MAG TPA: hypothetical protein VH054_29465 [Polyangiaceae bacterium]|nr:hypothetical protein [Polyangiaceae bacterium]
MREAQYTLEDAAVRFGRSKLWLAVSIVPSLAMLAIGLKLGVLLFLFPLPVAIGFLARGTQRARVVASREGVRIGERLVPRADLSAALVRHERDTTYVELRGRREIDIEVANNVEADALVRALGLDAASTTVDVAVSVPPDPLASTAVLMASTGLAFYLAMIGLGGLAAITGVVGVAIVIVGMGRATLCIGADGIVFRRAWGAARFVSHDDIVAVDVEGAAMIVREGSGRETRVTVREQTREGDDQARAIARRIVQARQAHRESGVAPELTVALDRGARTTREWIAELRKLGAGAASTFRTLGVVREQLVALVESTSASAKDRVAALAALRGAMHADEEKRVRVAVDRIAAPDVRQQMVRVLDARDDEELEEQLERFGERADT